MLIVDSQIHIWEPDTPERPWAADALTLGHRLDDPVTHDEVLGWMDATGVDGAILIPPSWAGDWNVAVAAAVEAHPGRFAAMGRVNVDEPHSADWLQEELEKASLTGFRMTFIRDSIVAQLRAGELEWFWDACEELDIPLMVYGPRVADVLEDVARAHPGVRLTLDHLNLTRDLDAAALEAHVEQLVGLAAYENVSVKSSSLPSYIAGEYPFPRVKPVVYKVVEAFGAERVFWGSDASRLACTYAQWRDFFLAELDALSYEEKALVMGRGLVSWLRLPAGFGQVVPAPA